MTLLILLLLLVIASAIIFIQKTRLKAARLKAADMEERVRKLVAASRITAEYMDEHNRLRERSISMTNKIKKAESDDEIYSALGSYIDDFNKRLRNNGSHGGASDPPPSDAGGGGAGKPNKHSTAR